MQSKNIAVGVKYLTNSEGGDIDVISAHGYYTSYKYSKKSNFFSLKNEIGEFYV